MVQCYSNSMLVVALTVQWYSARYCDYGPVAQYQVSYQKASVYPKQHFIDVKVRLKKCAYVNVDLPHKPNDTYYVY